jgi:hypothetical protein
MKKIGAEAESSLINEKGRQGLRLIGSELLLGGGGRNSGRSICPNTFPTIKSSKFPAYTATRRRPKRLLGSAQMIATTALDATPRSLLSEMRCLREPA